VATRDLLDEAGMLWLTRPEGWEEQLAALAETTESADAAIDSRRAERRREAAEQVAHRALAEIAALRAEAARLGEVAERATAEAAAARRERDAVRGEIVQHQVDLRHALDREAAAVERAERSKAAVAAARSRASEAERTRDDVLAARATAGRGSAGEAILAGAKSLAGELDAQVDTAHRLAKELTRLSESLAALEPAMRPHVVDPATPTARRRAPRSSRRPVALPGGVYGSSFAAAEFLARHQGVVVLVDGYNVAKLGWPGLTLAHQRASCIDAAEDIARRFGTNVAVIFDGATVLGATAPSRRLVRVRFSPAGVSADDVLREEVTALPATTPVVVVTNDQEVATDVRSHGANTMTSEQWLELAGRR
jgi:predicted RNA-binding protein with PIN domain